MDKDIDLKTLTSFIPFNTLSSDYLNKVIERAKSNSYRQGTLIFKRGKPLNENFYLLDGNIDLIDSQYTTQSVNPQAESSQYPLNRSSPSQVSAVAKSEAQILTVERDVVDLIMAWSESGENPQTDSESSTNANQLPTTSQTSLTDYAVEDEAIENDWMSCLLQSPLFTQIPPANIQKLFTRFDSMHATKGQTIIREGDPGDYFYVVESGIAHVSDNAKRIDLDLSMGQYFGEEALVGDTTRNASVTMAEAGTLMRLSKEDFKSLLCAPLLHRVSMSEIKKQSLARDKIQLLDVRLPVEFRNVHVPGCKNLPLSSLRNKLSDFDKDTTYVVSDDAGRRCDVATHLLCQEGFNAYILADSYNYYQPKPN